MNDIFKSPKKVYQNNLPVKRNKTFEKYTLEDLKKEYSDTILKILITSPKYDDIAKILDSIKIRYDKFKGNFNSDILFINCGTSDKISILGLRDFVKSGGCLYASDWASSFICDAFGQLFIFSGNIGKTGKMIATVNDQDLKDVLGNHVEIYFDLGNWSVLESIKSGSVLLESKNDRKPLMVLVPFGKGKIYYTCFHNHSQTSRAELILLQLLVLKQMSTSSGSSFKQISESVGVDLISLKNEIKRLKG